MFVKKEINAGAWALGVLFLCFMARAMMNVNALS